MALFENQIISDTVLAMPSIVSADIPNSDSSPAVESSCARRDILHSISTAREVLLTRPRTDPIELQEYKS